MSRFYWSNLLYNKIGHIIVMYREFKLNIYMKLLFKIWLLMAINYVLLLSSIHIDLYFYSNTHTPSQIYNREKESLLNKLGQLGERLK